MINAEITFTSGQSFTASEAVFDEAFRHLVIDARSDVESIIVHSGDGTACCALHPQDFREYVLTYDHYETPLSVLLAYSSLSGMPKLGWEEFNHMTSARIHGDENKRQLLHNALNSLFSKEVVSLLERHIIIDVDQTLAKVGTPLVSAYGHWFNPSYIP